MNTYTFGPSSEEMKLYDLHYPYGYDTSKNSDGRLALLTCRLAEISHKQQRSINENLILLIEQQKKTNEHIEKMADRIKNLEELTRK